MACVSIFMCHPGFPSQLGRIEDMGGGMCICIYVSSWVSITAWGDQGGDA